ncbi:unnamed protein product [Phytophthora lilii]|uniref:Unnamed protein product n=1 Tax=Phytophthora lilii TaxID=2077276 RepID=A0A9W6WTU2_9STRA|nr:unnamed protein product [Phytophthora lilii]
MAADGLHVDRAQSNAMNLQVLKRQDADVVDIVDTASHVVMYEFDQDAQSWVRCCGGGWLALPGLMRETVCGLAEAEGCGGMSVRGQEVRALLQAALRRWRGLTGALLQILGAALPDLREQPPEHHQHDAAAGRASGGGQRRQLPHPAQPRRGLRHGLRHLRHLVLPGGGSRQDPAAAPTVGDACDDIESAAITDAAPAKQQPAKSQSPAQNQTQNKPKQQQQQQQTSQPSQQQEQQQERPPSQSRNRGRSRNKRDDSKRRGAGANNPTAILQRSPKGKRSNSSSSGGSANGSVKQEVAPAVASTSGMIPISKADGIAAGEAIMGMFTQNQQQPQQQQQKQQTVSASSVSKEQLKQTLISLLDDAQFFDQIYHAYVDRVVSRG